MRICAIDCVNPIESGKDDAMAAAASVLAGEDADVSLSTFWDQQVTITVNNRGLNPLRIRFCFLDLSAERLGRHSQVLVNRCSEDALTSCPYLFPGMATTLAVIPMGATYALADVCTTANIDGTYTSKCVEAIKPIELHGFEGEWNNAIIIEYPGQRFCVPSAYSPDHAHDLGCGPDARCLDGFGDSPSFCGYTSVRWLLSGDKFATNADNASCEGGMTVAIAANEDGSGSIARLARQYNLPLSTVFDALPVPRQEYDRLEIGDTFCLQFERQVFAEGISADVYLGKDWERLQLQKVAAFKPWWIADNWPSLFHVKRTKLLSHREFDTAEERYFLEFTEAPDTWSWTAASDFGKWGYNL
jgi:hypothetical protein